MAELPVPRRPRGNYAPLICLNCRRRKIKCALPFEDIEPSEQPQPSADACQRCRALGLECIVQRTILGRPASKRRRTDGTQEDSTSVEATKVGQNEEHQSPGHAEVKEYLLTEVPDDNHLPSQGPKKTLPKFEAMVSSSHLMSALLANDRHFAVSCQKTPSHSSEPLIVLISHGMAALLDESLVWHRFYVPTTPTLVSLRKILVNDADDGSTPATELLYALLSLLALEAPSSRLREDTKLRHCLRGAVAHFGQQVLYSLPTHRHTFAALEILFNYKPTFLTISQKAAAPAVSSDLFLILAKRVAEKLGMQTARETLEQILEDGVEHCPLDIDMGILNALQWCSVVVEEAYVNGFLAMPPQIMKKCLNEMGPILHVVEAVIKVHRPSPRTMFHYFNTKASHLQLQHTLEARQHWRDLATLTDILERYEEACRDLQLSVYQRSDEASAGTGKEEAHKVMVKLVEMARCRAQITVPSVVMFYATMARLKSASEQAYDVSPAEAIQVSDQIIENLKSLQIGRAWELTQFLSRYGAARDSAIESLLSQFNQAACNLSMDSALYFPPPRQAGLILLSFCKLLVESNAARMRGWDGLDPRVDVQLELFAACAQELEAMAVVSGGTLDDAFADGCLNAASAKLIRSLHDIVVGWKATVARSEEDRAERLMSTRSEQSVSVIETLTDLEFEELFAQWSYWPQADAIDFTELLPSGSNWWRGMDAV